MARTLDEARPLSPSDGEIARALFGSDKDEQAEALRAGRRRKVRP